MGIRADQDDVGRPVVRAGGMDVLAVRPSSGDLPELRTARETEEHGARGGHEFRDTIGALTMSAGPGTRAPSSSPTNWGGEVPLSMRYGAGAAPAHNRRVNSWRSAKFS